MGSCSLCVVSEAPSEALGQRERGDGPPMCEGEGEGAAGSAVTGQHGRRCSGARECLESMAIVVGVDDEQLPVGKVPNR